MLWSVQGERCVAILHDVPASVQRAVLDQGSLRGCRDASAGCIGRVKKVILGRFRRGWALAMRFSSFFTWSLVLRYLHLLRQLLVTKDVFMCSKAQQVWDPSLIAC